MTDDEQGLQRAEQLESALQRELASRAEFHRNWLEAQLAPLTADADKVQRELEEAAARRVKQHHELENINPEEYRDEEGFRHNQSNQVWLAVAGLFGVTGFILMGTLDFFPRGTEVTFLAFADFVLALFGFLALTPLWSPAPKPPALVPERPALPHLAEEPLGLPGKTWRDRLELAQSRLTKLTKGDQSPERSGYLQQVLAQARADLQRFIADGRAYLANTESDHFGWVGRPWPRFLGTVRLLGLPAIPCALIPLGVTFGKIGLLHGAIALGGGLAAGFFRRSNLSFVEPPEPPEA
jgi:hypothetical protein